MLIKHSLNNHPQAIKVLRNEVWGEIRYSEQIGLTVT